MDAGRSRPRSHARLPAVNRGVAILDDTVYVGTLDGYLVALDARTGVRALDRTVGDNTTGHSITAAPLAVDGKVIVGISGGEAGIRGFPRRVRREDRQTPLALLDRARRASQAAIRGAATAGSTAPARLAHRLVRPRVEPPLLGNRQSRPRLERRRAAGRQPLHLFARSRSTSTPARGTGISSSRRTTCTTGTPTRFPCSSTPNSAGGRDRSSSWRTATASTTCSTARRASSCSARRTRSRPGPRARRERTADRDPGHGAVRERARSCIRACKARRTGPVRRTARGRHALRAGARDGIDLLQDRRSSTGPAPISQAAAKSGSPKKPGARCARSTSRPES